MNQAYRRPELALPAGSLQCALYAFEGGADAVYLGLKAFSARKNAVNFSFDDLRKLKHLCLEKNKKFYVTLNTLVDDREMHEVKKLLKQLDYIRPDGVIVQDLGIASLMRREFPNLPLHASTQLAVHTTEGVKVLQSLGFTRVVLARETSLMELKKIRESCPDVELKVFIHGALCYGFSGLCMASENITGRSANRGECAQICRTWFHCQETKEDLWPFSMKDLCVGEDVRKFAEIGIDSLKVEGRMKGPEYVYWCARYYSLLLDGSDDTEEAEEAMRTAFSRQITKGFLDTGFSGSCGSESMVCTDYPSHMGVQVGKIDRVLNGKAVVKFSKPVALRDGLLVVSGKESAGFSLTEISNGRSFAAAGETVTIAFPSSRFTRKPQSGTALMCTSRHNAQLPLLNENIPLYKKPLDISITLNNSSITVNGVSFPLELQEARNRVSVNEIFTRVFSASDTSLYTLGSLSVQNNSSFENPFMPLSSLKQIRRDFYAEKDRELLKEFEKDDYSFEKENTLSYVTLPCGCYRIEPVAFNEEELFKKLDEEKSECFALNNISHISWAGKHPDKKIYADQFLYTGNSEAYWTLKKLLPHLEGCAKTDPSSLPLFISRVCFRHHALKKDCRGCSKDNTYHISQNGRNYTVRCKNCMTTVTDSRTPDLW